MRKQSIIQSIVPLACGFALFTTVSLFVVGLVQGLKLCSDLQDELARLGELKPENLVLTTEVFDQHGEKIGELSDERRYYTPLANLPTHLVQAFLSAEDKDFYEHIGVSIKAITRSLVANVRGGRIKQGGSTITQQLARLYFLDQEKTLTRKIKEAVLALAMERQLEKDQILELYLNKIYLGNRSYGVEAAARNYFRKHAVDLSVGEAALLAGLPRAPNYYAPHKHHDRASRRQKFILRRMAEDGFISAEDAAAWTKKAVHVAKDAENYFNKAPYFLAAVQDELARKFEFAGVPEEGLKIYTTLDASLQRAAEKSLQTALVRVREQAIHQFKAKGMVEGAIFSMNPRSGAVLAMQGGGDFSRTQYNRATATKRRMGAIFMPIFLSLALERGYSLDSRLDADPMAGARASWSSMLPTLRDALMQGKVLDAARLYTSLGSGSVLQHAARFGLNFDREDLMVALGYGEASAADVAAAYSVFANGGYGIEPFVIARVDDAKGRVLYRAPAGTETMPELGERQVLSWQTAEEMRQLLRDNVNFGSAEYARGIDAMAGGVSAGTDDLHNAWFASVMPRIVSSIWLGAESGRVRLASDEASAANAAETLWADFMRAAPAVYREMPVKDAVSLRQNGAATGRGTRF